MRSVSPRGGGSGEVGGVGGARRDGGGRTRQGEAEQRWRESQPAMAGQSGRGGRRFQLRLRVRLRGDAEGGLGVELPQRRDVVGEPDISILRATTTASPTFLSAQISGVGSLPGIPRSASFNADMRVQALPSRSVVC